MGFTRIDGFSPINVEVHLWCDVRFEARTSDWILESGETSVSQGSCPSALVRDGKLARLFFFLSSLSPVEKGRKGPPWFSIERCAKAIRKRERKRVKEKKIETQRDGRVGERVRLHRAFPFPGYPSIPLSAVLVTQSKLSPSKLTYSVPADQVKYIIYVLHSFSILCKGLREISNSMNL